MIATYIYDLSELNKMGDIIILNLKDYSFSLEKTYSVSEIKDIINLKEKKVIINISPLYHNNEIEIIKNIIILLKDAYGFIFQDLGLVEIFKEINIIDKAIYAPETFITNRMDRLYFNKCGIKNFLLSREITLSDIDSITSTKDNNKYFYSSFGYQMMFYSYRHHFSNFDDFYKTNLDLKNKFNVSIKEETRNELYKTIEDNRGFRIYRDKILSAYEYVINSNIDVFILDRIFISDQMYFDTIDLYKGLINYNEYKNKYESLIDSGYLFKDTGLLKE